MVYGSQIRQNSVASFRERKLSTPIDRLDRQRQSMLFEHRNSPAFRDDLFASLPLFRTRGLDRVGTAETDVSPTEAHPGCRLPEPLEGWGRRKTQKGSQELSDVFPIPKPAIPRKDSSLSTSSHIAGGPTLDGNAVEAQSADFVHTSRPNYARSTLLQRLLNLFPRSTAVKPGAFSGLQVASAAATAHAKAILHHRSHLHTQRRHICITEYEPSDSAKPKRIPMTLNHISGIQHYLLEASRPRFTAPLLRVIYVHNNAEAMDFLTNLFHLDHTSFDKFEGSFKDWIQQQKGHRDSSNRTISWKPSYDVTRDITCTVFGLDLGSELVGMQAAPSISLPGKQSTCPGGFAPGPSASRLSIYLQRKLEGFPEAGKMDIFNSSACDTWQCAQQNTVLIFENSPDDSEGIIKCSALSDLDWKAGSSRDVPASDAALISTMEHILLHVFTNVLRAWRKQLALLSIQHAQLEDRVYGQPSDDSPATELWAMSKYLRGMAKLVNRHSNLIEDVQEHFNHFAERSDDDHHWLADISRHFQQASVTIQEDFIWPTEHMIDLMYKSVSIRDSRQSLELNTSLWRLSWITFIFLPLTFLVGFFGMNVDLFEHYPSVKYYFVAAVPLMTLILVLWFTVRQLHAH